MFVEFSLENLVNALEFNRPISSLQLCVFCVVLRV
jgi:hypothetical protein